MTVCGGEVVRHDISESRDLRTRVGIREYLGEKVVPVFAFYTRQFRLCNTSFLRTFMLSNMNVSRDIFMSISVYNSVYMIVRRIFSCIFKRIYDAEHIWVSLYMMQNTLG